MNCTTMLHGDIKFQLMITLFWELAPKALEWMKLSSWNMDQKIGMKIGYGGSPFSVWNVKTFKITFL